MMVVVDQGIMELPGTVWWSSNFQLKKLVNERKAKDEKVWFALIPTKTLRMLQICFGTHFNFLQSFSKRYINSTTVKALLKERSRVD